MLNTVESKKYKKSLKVYLRRADFSISKLEKVLEMLQKQTPLDPKYRDHKLKGDMESIRECHIQPNVLLLYKVLDQELILILVDIGSHPKLF